jgi:predicted DNA-binding transcriptional regulator AlpA
VSEHLPPWQDIAHLTHNLCISERTVDAWVKQGFLPPPRLIGGKRLWKWKDVERYLEGEHESVSASPDALAGEIRDATRKALQSS